MIDEDRWERIHDDVTGFLSEKACRSASVNEFKLTCKSITGWDNELGLKSGQEKENMASFSTSFASTKLTKERPNIGENLFGREEYSRISYETSRIVNQGSQHFTQNDT